MTAEPTSCVYLYRRAGSAQIVYVGKGASPQRALQHTGGTHNAGLQALIESGDYALEVAGPYASPDEAALVEAALISALSNSGTQAALVNAVGGAGHKFRPLGVPGPLAERALQPPLTLAQVGHLTGGALLVRNSFGEPLADGRPRLDPLSQDQDEVILHNLVKFWLLQRVVPAWKADPDSRPHVLLGCAGPPKHRYVPGAITLDRESLLSEPLNEVSVASGDADLDACQLRGRRVEVKFGRLKHQHFVWVDGTGTVRYGAQTDWLLV